MNEQTKCVSIYLSKGQIEQVKKIKEQTGKSQNQLLSESIMYGLKKFENSNNQLFWVKVRIDIAKMQELGAKLVSGELKTNMIKFTYCLQEDPTVGISLWEARNEAEFQQLFEPHMKFYNEIIDISPAIKPEKAMELILEQNS